MPWKIQFFTFGGRKKDYFIPYQLKCCISNHRQQLRNNEFESSLSVLEHNIIPIFNLLALDKVNADMQTRKR